MKTKLCLLIIQGNHYSFFYGFRVYSYNKDHTNYEKSQPFEWFRLQMIRKCQCKTIIYYRFFDLRILITPLISSYMLITFYSINVQDQEINLASNSRRI
jgi:hypothetical protein